MTSIRVLAIASLGVVLCGQPIGSQAPFQYREYALGTLLAAEAARPWISRQGRLKDLIGVHTSLAEALSRDAGVRASGRSARNRGRDPDPPLLAFETYSRAMAETDSKKRLGLLRQALQEFPGYAVASYQAATLLVRY